MSVALIAISSLDTFFFFFFSNTVPPVKSLIVIILVVKELSFVVQGVVEVVSGSAEFCTFNCSPKAAVPCSNRISWNVIYFLNMLIRFYLINLAGNVSLKCRV